MKRFILFALVVLLAVPMAVSAGIWPFGKDQTLKLGTDPSIGGTYQLDDGLGFVRVDAFDRELSQLTLTVILGGMVVLPDTEVGGAASCAANEPIQLAPGQPCALWCKSEKDRKEYHFRLTWSYEEKKGVRIVVIRLHKATLKLAK